MKKKLLILLVICLCAKKSFHYTFAHKKPRVRARSAANATTHATNSHSSLHNKHRAAFSRNNHNKKQKRK